MSVEQGQTSRGGLFRSRRWALAAAVAYTLVLYATLTLAYRLYVAVFERIGEAWMRGLLVAVLAAAGTLTLWYMVFRLRARWPQYAVLAAVAGVVGVTIRWLEVPANIIHFLQYGPLTVLWFEVLRFRRRGPRLYLWTLLLVFTIGVGDELLQSWMPDRRFDPMDIGLNALAAALTLCLLGGVAKARTSRIGARTDGGSQL